MTFYEELEKWLHNKGEGAFVLVQKNGGEYYCMFYPMKDNCDNYKASGWYRVEELAKKHIGFLSGYTEDEMNLCAREEDWKIIKTYSLRDLI